MGYRVAADAQQTWTASSNTVLVVDREGAIFSVLEAPETLRASGRTSVSGLSIEDLWQPRLAKSIRKHIRRTIRSRQVRSDEAENPADGRNYEFIYVPQGRERVLLVVRDISDSSDALTRIRQLAYQPITAADSGDVVGAEALLRWHHAEEGTISPADFVPVAEKTGLMRELGDFVIAEACQQLRDWLDNGMRPIRMAINLSLCQLLRGDVIAEGVETPEQLEMLRSWGSQECQGFLFSPVVPAEEFLAKFG